LILSLSTAVLEGKADAEGAEIIIFSRLLMLVLPIFTVKLSMLYGYSKMIHYPLQQQKIADKK